MLRTAQRGKDKARPRGRPSNADAIKRVRSTCPLANGSFVEKAQETPSAVSDINVTDADVENYARRLRAHCDRLFAMPGDSVA
mgnify:CR=1 FL=1